MLFPDEQKTRHPGFVLRPRVPNHLHNSQQGLFSGQRRCSRGSQSSCFLHMLVFGVFNAGYMCNPKCEALLKKGRKAAFVRLDTHILTFWIENVNCSHVISETINSWGRERTCWCNGRLTLALALWQTPCSDCVPGTLGTQNLFQQWPHHPLLTFTLIPQLSEVASNSA